MRKEPHWRKKPQFENDGNDNNLLPVMSLMLILIPFLVGNIAFFQFKSIAVTTPGLSQNDEEPSKPKKDQRNVIFQLKVETHDVKLTLLDEDTGDSIEEKKFKQTEQSLKGIPLMLVGLKNQYKKLNTILINVEAEVPYETLVAVLDKCREPGAALTQGGSVQKKKESLEEEKEEQGIVFNLVLLPKESENGEEEG